MPVVYLGIETLVSGIADGKANKAELGKGNPAVFFSFVRMKNEASNVPLLYLSAVTG